MQNKRDNRLAIAFCLIFAIAGSWGLWWLVRDHRPREGDAQRAEKIKALHTECKEYLKFLEEQQQFLQLVDLYFESRPPQEKLEVKEKARQMMGEKIRHWVLEFQERKGLQAQDFNLRKPTWKDMTALRHFMKVLLERTTQEAKEIQGKWENLSQATPAEEDNHNPRYQELKEMVEKQIAFHLINNSNLQLAILEKMYKLKLELLDEP